MYKKLVKPQILLTYRARHNNINIKLWASRSYATDPAYYHQVGKEPLVYRNLGQHIERAAELYAKRPAIISCHEQRRLSFDEARNAAANLAIKLRALGLKPGEHLGIWAPSTIQWYITMLAAGLGGYRLVCLNPALQAQEIEYALRKAKVKTLITMDECGKQNFDAILRTVLNNEQQQTSENVIKHDNFPELQRIIMKSANNTNGRFLNYDELMATAVDPEDVAQLKRDIKRISPESPCNIQFTSGTTGQPKAALLTHFGFVNVGHYFGQSINLHASHKRICMTVPFFHVFALGLIVGSLDYGATLVVPSATFNSVSALEAIEQEGCNILPGTPTMFVDMQDQQRKLNKVMHSLELAFIGGAACSPEVYSDTKKVLGIKEVRIGYGLSEATAAVCAQDGTEIADTAVHTVGKFYEHTEAKVINEDGKTVGLGEPGELCLRGYFTMGGYIEDEEKTKEVLNIDGWLKTGDIFVLETAGIGRILGRKKEIIIRGGENIFPKEVEDFLNTHEDILELYIIGVPDKRMGEELCAFLRLKEGAKTLDIDDIKMFCKGRIAHFKIPRYIRIVEDFPKTASGKIQKFKLLESFQNELQ